MNPVAVRKFQAIRKVFLHLWVQDKVFPNSVPCKFPGELVSPTFLFIMRLPVQSFGVAFLDFAMVGFDHFR